MLSRRAAYWPSKARHSCPLDCFGSVLAQLWTESFRSNSLRAAAVGRALRCVLVTTAEAQRLTRLRHSHSHSLVVAAAGGIGSTVLISATVTSTHDSRADSADASCCASAFADRTPCVCFEQAGVTLPLPLAAASPSVRAIGSALAECDWESAENAIGADEAAPSLLLSAAGS